MSVNDHEWIGWKWIDAFAKIAIPLSVTLLAICQNSIQKKNEKAMQEMILSNQQAYQNTATDLKLVEILWPLLVSSDSLKIMSSLKLAQNLRPELSDIIMKSVFEDETQPWYVRREASLYIANKMYKLLFKYKINVYFNTNDTESERTAKGIEQLFALNKLNCILELSPRDSTYFDSKNNYIYYTKVKEYPQAQALAAFIQSYYPNISFKLYPVDQSENNVLSLYIYHITYNKSIETEYSPGVSGISE